MMLTCQLKRKNDSEMPHSAALNIPIYSHLLAGVPVERRPLQDEPEALPLLREEDAGLLPLLPQPTVTVGPTQLAAGHAAPTHSRRHSWEDKHGREAKRKENTSVYFISA